MKIIFYTGYSKDKWNKQTWETKGIGGSEYCVIKLAEYLAKEGHKVKAESFLSVCKQMMKKFPRAKKVITTLRGSISASHNTWAGVMYDGKKMYKSSEYQITDIVDRVGGGDSFMGGLIYGLIKYKNNDQKALDFAVAASCLKHTIKGDANLVLISEVEKLMGGDASGRVSR